MKKGIVLGIGLTACAVFAACGDDGSSRQAVPRPLNTIEEQAEDIIDVVPANDWDTVRADVSTIDEAWNAYRDDALDDGADQRQVDRFDRALTGLHSAAAAERGAETKQRANDVSAVVVELFGLYDARFPIAIGRLDVIGRQIAFDADLGDLADARRQVERAERIWRDELEDDVLERDGAGVADKTDGALAELMRAARRGDIAALRTDANLLLELVDSMEALY
jgi:hypothetical protein